MKKVITLIALALLRIGCFAVNVETTTNLNVYYPDYTMIDLVCGLMPKAAQKDVEFCCEAAFTGELLNEFKHTNIADNHICNGEMKKGYRCKANTGGFVWGKGKWKFMRKADYHALYLDMGRGWNYAWYRDKDGKVKDIFPESKLAPSYKYRTNWITFYK